MEDNEVLHPHYGPNELVGDWDPNIAKVLFHCYYLSFNQKFKYNFPFCGVVLLLRHKLDASVQSMLIDLETTSGVVTVQSAHAGSLQLTSYEVEIARKFQLAFLGLLIDHNLDKMNGGINKSVKENMMYLLLPVVNTTSQGLFSSIDWACIRQAFFF